MVKQIIILDIQYNNTEKHYQSFYFDSKPLKCQFNYDLQ